MCATPSIESVLPIAESQIAEIQSLGADVRFKPLWLDELVTLARDMLHTPVRD